MAKQAKESYGSLLELTWRGQNPIKLPNGEERKFLAVRTAVMFQTKPTVLHTGWGYCDIEGLRPSGRLSRWIWGVCGADPACSRPEAGRLEVFKLN